MQINATMWAGIVAFGAAALLAWAAARATRRDAPAWRLIALVHAALAIEVVAMTRHRASDYATHLLIQRGIYAGRRGPQALLLVVIAVAALFVATRIRARLRRVSAPARTGALLTMLLVALFAIETVSLHQVDRLLYMHVGPIATIGWAWLALGFGTAAAALLATGRR